MSGEGWSFIPAEDSSLKKERPSKPYSEQKLILRVEKRNKGKVVTRITGLNISDEEKKQLLKECKIASGGGGTSGENWIEIQGEHLALMERILNARGCNSIVR